VLNVTFEQIPISDNDHPIYQGTADRFIFGVMYSRQEASLIKQEFWTAFGQYLAPVPSADGEKVNWVNYRTGEKDLRFRMAADNKKAVISIDLTHKDEGIRLLYYEQLLEFRSLLHQVLGEEWTWLPQTIDENDRPKATVYQEHAAISIYKKEDWPALISFFKPRILALDEFWSNVKYQFELLRG
jgi:hypothetical protein